MAIQGIITSQTGGRQFDGNDITKYSHFVGGVNATYHALQNYSPLVNGFGRLFMVRPPLVLLRIFGGEDGNLYSKDNQFIQFKHMMEYMNRSVTGFNNKSLETANTPIQGGFAGRQFTSPTVTKNNTTSVRIGLYEMVGCPVRTVIDMWMNAIGDENSGLATYGGWISGGRDSQNFERRLYRYAEGAGSTTTNGIPFNEANHTAECIYIMHDRSGAQVESAVMLADMYPTGIQEENILNMEAGGNHDHVTYDLEFNCICYRSPIINAIADDLLKQYRIVSNVLNFNPQLGDAIYADDEASTFNRALGPVPVDSATGTNVGNLPVYHPYNTPETRPTELRDINQAKASGRPNLKTPEYYGDHFSEDTGGFYSAAQPYWGYERDETTSVT